MSLPTGRSRSFFLRSSCRGIKSTTQKKGGPGTNCLHRSREAAMLYTITERERERSKVHLSRHAVHAWGTLCPAIFSSRPTHLVGRSVCSDSMGDIHPRWLGSDRSGDSQTLSGRGPVHRHLIHSFSQPPSPPVGLTQLDYIDQPEHP